MAFSPLSFLLGIGAACALPSVSRNIRPIVVEAAVSAIGWLEELRRVAAEQIENLEDLAAEVRARREQLAEGTEAEPVAEAEDDHGETENGAAPPAEPRPRRRAPLRTRPRQP
jgi:hypothetical protein